MTLLGRFGRSSATKITVSTVSSRNVTFICGFDTVKFAPGVFGFRLAGGDDGDEGGEGGGLYVT